MPRKKSEADMAPFCVRGALPNYRRVYAVLRREWKKQEEGRTYKALAKLLEVTEQSVAQWETGSGGKGPPPLWVLMRLCEALDLVIVLSPHQTSLHEPAKPTKS